MKNFNNPVKGKLQVIVAYFLIYVVWGSTYYFIGLALHDFPPFVLGALRFSIAGAILFMWCYVKDVPLLELNLIKKSALSGFVLLFVDMAVIMLAQQYISSSLVAIIASSTAIWITLFDVPAWKYNFRKTLSILGIGLGFSGVLLLYVEQYQNEAVDQLHERGILILIVGCISWALGTLFTKYYLSDNQKTDSFAGAAWQMIFASLVFWLISFTSGEIQLVQFNHISITSWLSLCYLVIFGSLFAYSAYIWLLKVRPAAEVATHAYVNPVIAILFGVIAGNEEVSWLQVLGLVIIILSVGMVNRKSEVID